MSGHTSGYLIRWHTCRLALSELSDPEAPWCVELVRATAKTRSVGCGDRQPGLGEDGGSESKRGTDEAERDNGRLISCHRASVGIVTRMIRPSARRENNAAARAPGKTGLRRALEAALRCVGRGDRL